MAAQPDLAGLETDATQNRSHAARSQAIADYWALTKPEVNFLILVTTFAGFYLGSPLGAFRTATLFHTLLGTLLVAGGTGTLNQYIERRFDAQMRRTARRPLACGRMRPKNALWFGICLSVFGVAYLAVATNFLASLLAFLTLTAYLFFYTPLKRKSALCTIVGAFPGAVPPLIGWAAASGTLSAGAWVLYATLFLWQFPHFMAIAWMYREDYSRAGYLVLPTGKTRDTFLFWQAFILSLGLIPITLIPVSIGRPHHLAYSLAALLLSSAFSCLAARLSIRKSNVTARQLLLGSVAYLPAIFALMMFSK
jgi:protoheme IX farnesyltransferase